jgi:hypothetical protein
MNIKLVLNEFKGKENHLPKVQSNFISLLEYKYGLSSVVESR